LQVVPLSPAGLANQKNKFYHWPLPKGARF